MPNLFERLSKERPSPSSTKTKTHKDDPAQRLLDFLQKWHSPTIRSVDILMYGPNCTRKRDSANDATEVLEERGWLIPLPTNQSNWRRWQIVRKPTVYPTIAD
jgi:hypothetical protein